MDTNQQQYQSLWQSCLLQVKKCTSEEEFIRLFKPLEPIDFSGGVLRLKVPSKQHIQHIEQNYINILVPIVRNTFGQTASISYAVPRVQSQTTTPAMLRGYTGQSDGKSITNPFIIPGIKRVKFDSQLRPEYTLANFIEGDCNRLVRSAGVSISVSPGGSNSFNPLFVYGGSGMGKTHIVQAIGNAIAERIPEQKILYVSANRFQSQFQYAAHHNELSDFIQFYQMIDVLILDDIQEFAGKPGTQNIFFNIFNHLHMLGKQLIMTSDRPPIELKDIEERLITRFKWGLTAEIMPPDLNTKIAILKHKAKTINLSLSDEIIHFIASNITSNVRELEGSITSLNAHSQLLGRELNLDLTRSILRDIVTIKTNEISIDKILDTVSKYYKIDLTILLSSKRTRTVATARQIAMYLCKTHTKSALGAIGNAIGGKNHATVLYACKTVSNLMDTDKDLKIQIEELERKLQY